MIPLSLRQHFLDSINTEKKTSTSDLPNGVSMQQKKRKKKRIVVSRTSTALIIKHIL